MSRIAKNEIYFGRDVPLEEVARGDRRGHATTTSCASPRRLFRPERARAHRARRPEGRSRSATRCCAGERAARCASRSCACGAGATPLPLPRYMSAGAAGMDLLADVDGDDRARRRASAASCRPGSRSRFPPGFEGQVRPRSGLALRDGLTLLNAPGHDRRRLPRRDPGAAREPRTRRRSRIAPRRPHRAARGRAGRRASRWDEVTELPASGRGAGGFGSTGRGGAA